MNIENKYDALVRAIMGECSPLILAMYDNDLKKYAKDAVAFEKFYSDVLSIAKHWRINAIFYDEVASLKTMLQGKFLHASKTSPERVCTCFGYAMY